MEKQVNMYEIKSDDKQSKFRYFLELSYSGQGFNGWQRQLNAPSVQQSIEDALSILLRKPTTIVGCGRTDTGVHASFYVAHFECIQQIEDVDKFVYRLNRILPHQIAISRMYATNMHARFDATMREYQYFIQLTKSPFNREGTWQFIKSLDINAIREAAQCLLKHEDFTSFAKLHSDNKTNICHITHVQLQEIAKDRLMFEIRADRFLRGMIRGIVGTLVDVGLGKISPQHFDEIIQAKDRSQASAQAPPQGLFLSDVSYPGVECL